MPCLLLNAMSQRHLIFLTSPQLKGGVNGGGLMNLLDYIDIRNIMVVINFE